MKKEEYSEIPFLFGEDRGALVFGDLLVVVNPNYQVVSHCLGLPKRIGMAKMDHIIAAKQKKP